MGINLIHESGLVHALLLVILTLFYLELSEMDKNVIVGIFSEFQSILFIRH